MFLASKSRKEYNALCHCPPFLGEADKHNRRGFGVQVQHHQTPLQYMYVWCFRSTVASLFFNMFQCCINLVKLLECRGSQKRSTQHYKLPCPPPSLVLAKWGAHPSCHQIFWCSNPWAPGPNIWCNMICQYMSYLLLAPSMAGVLLKQCICIHATAMHVLFQEVLYLRVIRVLYKNYTVLLFSHLFLWGEASHSCFTSFTEQWTSRQVPSYPGPTLCACQGLHQG